MTEAEPQEAIDAVGLKCPEPVMLLHAAMRRLTPGKSSRFGQPIHRPSAMWPIFASFLATRS